MAENVTDETKILLIKGPYEIRDHCRALPLNAERVQTVYNCCTFPSIK